MKRIAIFGSTGSIGTQTLSIIEQYQEQFKIVCLSCNKNADLLFEQVKKFMPKKVAINQIDFSHPLNDFCNNEGIELIVEANSSHTLSQYNDIDLAINAIVGSEGLIPTFNVVSNNIDLALSNKESLVLGGHIIMPMINNQSSNIIPVDSEHSAIFQCLVGEPKNSLKKIILTGSGGPFLNRPLDSFSAITKEEALNHPNWDMGNKISIDSATMMNKGLEYIEALWLFNIEKDQLEIVIHPESIVHSLVQFVDDSYKAQLGVPDMKVPIQYALSYPERLNNDSGALDFEEMKQLNFFAPDLNRYPCLNLAMNLAHEEGNSIPIMSIANDYVVELFLNGEIGFIDIANTIEKTVNKFHSQDEPTIEDLVQLNKEIKVYLGSKL
ncbi:MAG: 1-deoxy-D-xylulose-5-phosphate reductoisomerase [Candidatus Neomarinimicrobiota bacterium]|nr:1-deoxy-D-xylulose-5-phosphate reductoisomerase [Candidatus Neomarinimicrobiota bacterium]